MSSATPWRIQCSWFAQKRKSSKQLKASLAAPATPIRPNRDLLDEISAIEKEMLKRTNILLLAELQRGGCRGQAGCLSRPWWSRASSPMASGSRLTALTQLSTPSQGSMGNLEVFRHLAMISMSRSGKSNILDAICFLMGITNLSHVRAENLQVSGEDF